MQLVSQWEVWRGTQRVRGPSKFLILSPACGGFAANRRQDGDIGQASPPRAPPLRKWRERWAEEGSTALLDDLLAVVRMRRSESALVGQYGREHYEATYAGCLWGIYQMLGKLQPTVYLLARG